MECQRCYNEVRGGVVECEINVTLDTTAPHQEPATDCNWIECQACSKVICFNCCRYPATNFCDDCITRLNLRSELIELGCIPEEL